MSVSREMRAAVISSPRQISVRREPIPVLKAREVLVRVDFCGLGRADLRSYQGDHPTTIYPIIPGAEITGTVAEIGPCANGLVPGQRVAIEPVKTCGACVACRINRYNCCAKLGFLGINVNGGMAEFVAVPVERAHVIPDGLPSLIATLCEPFSVGLQAVERAQIRDGEEVVILGGGIIGLAALLIARSYGARVLVAEPDATRRELAIRLGADASCTGELDEVKDAVLRFTHGDGARVVVDASGIPSAIALATEVAGPAARVAIISFTKQPVEFSTFDIVSKELDVYGVRNCCGLFPRAVHFVATNMANVEQLISGVWPLSEVSAAFRFADKQGTQILRIIIDISM